MLNCKITDIKLMMLHDADTPPWNLIRVDTDQGVWGLGEAYWGYGYREVIEKYLKPLLIGENPLDVDRLYTKMSFQLGGAHALSGLVVSVMSGIEIALWDLAGKLTGLPVYRLLGGKFRDKIRLYRTGSPTHMESLECWKEYAGMLREQGYTAIKTIDVEGLPLRYDPAFCEPGHEKLNRRLTALDQKRAEQIMRNIRLAFGEDYDVAVHCHWALDLRDSLELVKRMAPYRPIWLEDPLPVQFSSAWVDLTRASDVPICMGENLYTKHEFRPVIEERGCDIVQPDIPKAGGLLETKRIADMADTHLMQVCAHNASSSVGYIASAHVACTIRGFYMMERAGYDWPWLADLINYDHPLFEDGYIRVPDGPGLGITLNGEVAKQHLAKGEEYWGD